jgi:hypothetical protein
MIQFSNWTISALCGEVIARQYDNLSASLIVVGDLPDGWEWAMLVECQGNLNIIPLSPVEGGVGATLTDDMLSLPGYYTMQLRGMQGDVVRHTNQIQVFIPESLSGDAQWPEVPSEFTEIEQNIIAINNNPPKPGSNGFWLIYNPETGEYEESDIPLPEGGGFGYQIGHGLKVTGTNTLEVDTATDVEQDNTLPITSAAVYTTVGNIEILLGTI